MIRVMVIDDSALVRRLASDILAADPEISVVTTAARAEFALPKLDKEKPDVITLDLEMPGMGRDGADGLRELHRRGGHVIAQDKDSSVIYGMNREVVQNGNADELVPVDAIARRIVEALRSRAEAGKAI